MNAYFGQQHIKEKYIKRMEDHIAADELIRGVGFQDGKGCAVGCILNAFNHKAFEDELGIPEWLARILDTLHENTSDTIWPTFSLRFLQAVQPGMELEQVKAPFLLFVLKRCHDLVLRLDIDEGLKKQVIDVISRSSALYEGAPAADAAWAARAVAKAARDAARAAEDAAEAVAKDATGRTPWTVWAARDAARAAEDAAEAVAGDAARAAEDAAEAVAGDAAWAPGDAVGGASRAAEKAARAAAGGEAPGGAAGDAGGAAGGVAESDLYAEKLLELIANCPKGKRV